MGASGEAEPERALRDGLLRAPLRSIRLAPDDCFRERVRLHQAASGGYVPGCSPEERCERPTTYAVMRRGLKSALRVFDNVEQARELAGGESDRHVEVRPGRAIRCEGYCPVAKFCPQRRTELGESLLDEAAPMPPAFPPLGDAPVSIH